MSKKQKIAAYVECPTCHQGAHVLLKMREVTEPKIVQCMHCGRDMRLDYEMTVRVEATPLPRHVPSASRSWPLEKLAEIAMEHDTSHSRVRRAIGSTWTKAALIDGGADV